MSVAGLFKRYGTLAGFAAVVLVFWMLLPDTFITVRNLLNLSQQISMLAVVAMTMTIVMAMNDFDLSVGSLASLSGIIAAVSFTHDWPIAMALVAAMSAGVTGGLINGWLVSYLGILPFVATLGTMTIYSGAAFLFSGGKTLFGRDIPEAFGGFSRGGVPLDWLGIDAVHIPALTVIALVVFILVWYLLERRVFGRHLYVIGNNKEAARLAGINVKRLRLIAFAFTGAGAAIAGLMLASRVASANPTQGAGLMLDAIAAVFLGMSLHRRGEPRVLTTFFGVLMLGLVDNGLTQLSVDSYVREILVGIILLIAVGFSAFAGKSRSF